MKRVLLIVFIGLCQLAFSQQTGIVRGLITDKEMNNEPLPFANVYIKGTSVGVMTDMNGEYLINAPEGAQKLVLSFMGYKTIERDIEVVIGKTIVINETMGGGGETLQEVVVRAVANREKETVLLAEQKKAVAMRSNIGSQEMSRKAVSDVASAVTKTIGVSKQAGTGIIFVRGLGDRYNVTTLNGLPLPSNDPSKKNIDLSIFSTDIVESISLSKTLEAQNYADFGGANINIRSKRFYEDPYIKVKLGMGLNASNLNTDHFYMQGGSAVFGFNTTENPTEIESPTSYKESWDRVSGHMPYNFGVGINGGKKFNLSEKSSVKTFFTVSFKNKNNYQEGVERSGVEKSGNLINIDYDYESFSYRTNTTAMGVADFQINENNSLVFNTLFINSSHKKYSEYEGTHVEFTGGSGHPEDFSLVKRGSFRRTQIFVNQLLAKHKLSERYNLNWGVAYGIMNENVPDRMQMSAYAAMDNSNQISIFDRSAVNSHRYFQRLKENELSANTSLDYLFSKKDDDYLGKITLGYSLRFKRSDYYSQMYMFDVNDDETNFDIDDFYTNIDKYLSEASHGDSYFTIKEVRNDPYKGSQLINAGFLKTQYKLSKKLTAVVGLRAELLTQRVAFSPIYKPRGVVSKYVKPKLLPNLSAKYAVNDKNNLRLSLSKSYTLPQLKEKVNLPYDEISRSYYGNEDLYSSTNYNIDLSWQFFPSFSEIFTLTSFTKYIQNPINEVFINSAAGDISYVNSGDLAKIYGLELSLKKNIYKNVDDNGKTTRISWGFNAAYMHARQDFDTEKVAAENSRISADFTFKEGRLTGASDFLINSDISFSKDFDNDMTLNTTLSYSYFSDKIRAIGTMGRGHLIDKGNQQLDFALQLGVTKRLQVSFYAKNILNPLHETVQEGTSNTVVTKSFRMGSVYNLSLSYKF